MTPRRQNRASARVALGGSMGALSLLLLFLSGVFPFATYALPAAAGVALMPVVVEIGYRWALAVYGGISILGLLFAPDKEAALLFVFFLGYYPIIKARIERLSSRLLQWLCKLGLLNIAIALVYFIMVRLLGLTAVIEEFGQMGTGLIAGLWVLANVTGVVYDIALTRVISMYVHWFRPRFLKRLG